MSYTVESVLDIRCRLTELVDILIDTYSTDEVISEVMSLRGYNFSPYSEEIRKTLKEVGIFKFDYISDLTLVSPKTTNEELNLFGLVNSDGSYFLSGRYVVPIRDIAGRVTALVGWYPDVKKYLTTTTIGFSKSGQFFNMECFSKSFDGDYAKYKDEETNEVLESKGLVYLVEGIFDTLSLRSLNLPALGNMGLDMSLVKSEILTRFNKVIAIPDNDRAGMRTNPYLNRLSGSGKGTEWTIKNNHVIVQLPKGVKDVDDFIKGYYCLEDLLKCQKANYKISLSEE